jgi:hypothetical protein
MPKQNPLTRLDAVAAGLGRMADELHAIYGEPTLNLLYWRNEIVEAIEELSAGRRTRATISQPGE